MGAPVGNQNAVKNRLWREAVERALRNKSRVDTISALDDIAERLVEAAMKGPSYEKGDPWPFTIGELADRLDGKPRQQVELSGDEGAPLRILHESK